MSIDNQKESEIAYLVTRCLDGNRTKEDIQKLEELFSNDTSALDFYFKLLQVNLSLKQSHKTDVVAPQDATNQEFDRELWQALAQTEKIAPAIERETMPCTPPETFQRQKHVRTISKRSLFAIAASAAAILMATVMYLTPPKIRPVVGRVSRCAEARWEGASGSIEEGCDLFAGPLKLTKGLAEITLDSGTVLILEAPVSLELINPSRLFLWRGRIVAYVKNSPEERFFVQTSTATVVDYGTEFGVDVDSAGRTDTFVFQGQIELRAGSDPLKFTESLRLKQGDSGRVGSEGIQNIHLHAERFINEKDFNVHMKASSGSRYHQWLVHKRKMCQNPNLVAYYTFEQDKSQPAILKNQAIGTEARLDGGLYSSIGGPLPSWTDGRWPQKNALHFNRSDGQVVIVPTDPALHINGPITIAAWVRCSTPQDGGHLVSCRTPDGQGNYQLGYKSPREKDKWTGTIQFLRPGSPLPGRFTTDRVFSEQVFTASPEWRFVAVTHDNQTVKMYIDGQHIETHDFVFQQLPVDADLVIGGDQAAEDPSRFMGDMDELMIFNRVLEADEINDIYRAGRP
jgi:ferric-dicitrate binding protein FerR (iron transport regulator)